MRVGAHRLDVEAFGEHVDDLAHELDLLGALHPHTGEEVEADLVVLAEEVERVQQDRGLHAGEPAESEPRAEVGPGEQPRHAADVDQVADVEGHFDEGHGRHRDLDEVALRGGEAVGLERLEPIAELAEQVLPVGLLFGRQLRRHEVVRLGQGAEERRKR